MRIDRVTTVLAGSGLVLLLVATVFVTLLAAGDAGDSGTGPARRNDAPTITLDGKGVAAYIAGTFDAPGVTCPTVATPIDGAFLCSDPSGGSFTVQIIDRGRAYAVHPNQ